MMIIMIMMIMMIMMKMMNHNHHHHHHHVCLKRAKNRDFFVAKVVCAKLGIHCLIFQCVLCKEAILSVVSSINDSSCLIKLNVIWETRKLILYGSILTVAQVYILSPLPLWEKRTIRQTASQAAEYMVMVEAIIKSCACKDFWIQMWDCLLRKSWNKSI